MIMTKFVRNRDDVIKIADDIIEIGQRMKDLAKVESFIDFKYRANQLHHISQLLQYLETEEVNVTHYIYKLKGGE